MKLPPDRQWDRHQAAFLREAELCRSVAVSGEAGSGKSTAVLHLLQQQVRRSAVLEGGGTEVVVLVQQKALSQELAAVSGVRVETLHSFFRLGPQELSLSALNSALQNPAVLEKVRRCQLLVIDEVFTVHCELFEALQTIFSTVPLLGSSESTPFGGRKLIGWLFSASCPQGLVLFLGFRSGF